MLDGVDWGLGKANMHEEAQEGLERGGSHDEPEAIVVPLSMAEDRLLQGGTHSERSSELFSGDLQVGHSDDVETIGRHGTWAGWLADGLYALDPP